MVDFEKVVCNTAYELLRKAATILPEDVKEALARACKNESVQTGKAQLEAILNNLETAEKNAMCICQDTGVPLFFVKWGLRSGLTLDLKKPLTEATKRATRDVPLRPNVINPLTNENPGTNTGWGMPYVYFELDPESSYLELTAVPKGFGSEATPPQIEDSFVII